MTEDHKVPKQLWKLETQSTVKGLLSFGCLRIHADLSAERTEADLIVAVGTQETQI